MAKANANTVSDKYAPEGAVVRRAVGDLKEVITAGVSSDEIDKDVPGQTPAELKKSGQPVGEEVRKPTAFNQMQGEEPSRVGDDSEDVPFQTGRTVETAPGGGVTEDQAANAKTDEERREEGAEIAAANDPGRGRQDDKGGDSSSVGSSSARSSKSSGTTANKNVTGRRS